MTARERFEEKYEVAPSGCWLWTALQAIAEGNLGDASWQAGYERVQVFALAVLAGSAEAGKP